ncbi:MAG TPA: phosphoribosylaminoimidazolesuccinocarboxamide synthase [Acidimicrobiales bacterium]|nr:phosphoribosylaminoimidazolesuccinocarboxamide synthase [Acidimicrobiales bacterium]
MTLTLRHEYSGKVRDVYALDDERLLMVASDRLSAFDVVMGETIPHKGRVLTGLTDYWVRLARVVGVGESALVTCDPTEIDAVAPGFIDEVELHGRTMLTRRAEMVPLECIVRGRLFGQAYEEYRREGTVHHMAAPAGLALCDPFPEPLFTPSTKAVSGHDENIDHASAIDLVGERTFLAVREASLALFALGAARLGEAGLVLADTKFEFGYVEGRLVLCDEVMTPDSSRLWPAEAVVPGRVPPSFDKQPFRDWLDAIGWDHTPPPPPVPLEVVEATAARYAEAYERVTGCPLSDWYGG